MLNLPIYILPRGAHGGTRGRLGMQRQVSVSDKTDDIWPEAMKQKVTRCCVGN